jgi:hypothetical protein
MAQRGESDGACESLVTHSLWALLLLGCRCMIPTAVRFLVCTIIALSVLGRSAHACTLCVAYPKQSPADFLIDSPCVVLARENPDLPFSYTPIEVLKASQDVAPIDLLLDSKTRRLLSADPGRVVVLAREIQGTSWLSLGVADAEYITIVRRLLAFAPQWQGPQGKSQRVEFFLPLVGNQNATIRELAYLELARAPYETIKRLAPAVPRKNIEPILRDPIFIEWRPLAILLLAQSTVAADKQYIIDSFRSAERIGLTRNLAAWAAASIEVQGVDAVTYIHHCYFSNPDRKRDELIEVVKATSLHGTEGRIDLRDQIVNSYGTLLDVHPSMLEYIVKDLINWDRTELTQRISSIEAKGITLDPATQKTVRKYLRGTESDH